MVSGYFISIVLMSLTSYILLPSTHVTLSRKTTDVGRREGGRP